MTRAEVGRAISEIIREAVVASGGDTAKIVPRIRYVESIFTVMGRLAPEVVEKPKVPEYDPKKVRRVGTLIQRTPYSKEQRDAAVEALRAVGLL